MSTFHKIHPEILDTIIAIKYDDAKNKAMVTEEAVSYTHLLHRLPQHQAAVAQYPAPVPDLGRSHVALRLSLIHI